MQDLENEGEKELMDELESPRKGGIFLMEDDLEAGQLICVHSIKCTNDAAPIMGQSLTITSVCLPYFTATIYADPNELLTLDVRYLRLMKVTEDFAKAQLRMKPKRGSRVAPSESEPNS
jgi:hypothetical protein